MRAEDLGLDLSLLPSSDAEAERRFEKWRSVDPFPDVAPALLNTADLFDYITTTGMIHPFRVDPEQVDHWLKPASCAIRLGGRFIYWEYEKLGTESSTLNRVDADLAREDGLELPRNSIVYATLEPIFRLPDYLAARFNLSIKFVYRGLLVGTGPLVDPGFQGRLSIPLHNLTAHACYIPSDDAVLWMEFTKLSELSSWTGASSEPSVGKYVQFPNRKLARKDVGDYVDRARRGQPIISSIPELVQRATEEAKRTRRNSGYFQLATGVALIALILGIAAFVLDIRSDVVDDTTSAIQRSERLEKRVSKLERRSGSDAPRGR